MDAPLILHVTTDTGVGGTESRLALFFEHTDSSKLRHELVTLKPKGKLAHRIEACGIPVTSLELNDTSRALQAVGHLRRLISQRQPRVVQTHLFHANAMARPIARVSGVSSVISGYASVDTEMPIWRRIVDAATARFAHIHLANCRAVAAAAARRIRVSEKNFRIVYPGRPDPLAREQLASIEARRQKRNPPLVVSVGRLHRAKGHHVLLEALQGVGCRWEAVIVGDGPCRRDLEQKAIELGISNRVRFAGEVEDPAAYYAEAAVFVLPSLWEGMPGALIEAMFWAVPIVATAVGGVPEAVKHAKSALLASPGDPEALGDLIEEAIENKDLSSRIAAEARNQAKQLFSVENMVREWEAVYYDALASQH
ncbi:MAG: hypothetical protein C4319_04035 [Acidimicrobiia bacterium]